MEQDRVKNVADAQFVSATDAEEAEENGQVFQVVDKPNQGREHKSLTSIIIFYPILTGFIINIFSL